LAGRTARSATAGRRRPRIRQAGRLTDRIELAAVRYVAARDRAEAQFQAHLAKLGAGLARIRALTALFRARGYLNDEALALRWSRSRLASRPIGRARLEAELLRRGFGRDLVRRTADRVYDETSEEQLAARLMSRVTLRPGGSELARRAGFLRRRGFSEEIIEAVLGRETFDR
jgi:regulatory protein